MARSRNIKPSFFKNDVLASLDLRARILFAGLWTIADREGRLEDRPAKIKAECLPYDDCDVDALLNSLATGKKPFIHRYEVDGEKYIQVVTWHKHQSPHVREPESDIPPAPVEPVLSTSPAPAEPVGSGMRVKGIRNQESEGGCKGGVKFSPPSVEDVAAYCVSRSNKVDPQTFVDFYTSKGWKVGREPMKDWKASVRTWEKNEHGARGSPPKNRSNVAAQLFQETNSQGTPNDF